MKPRNNPIPILLAGWGICLLSHAAAADPAPAFLRMAFAVTPGTGKTRLWIDGREILPKGYDTGQCTGGIGLPPGAHHIGIRRETVRPLDTTVTLLPGETATFAACTDPPPPGHPNSRPAARLLRIPHASHPSLTHLTLVSVSHTPELTLDLSPGSGSSSRQLTLHRLIPLGLPVTRDPSALLLIRCGNNPPTRLSLEEHGNHILFLHDSDSGTPTLHTWFDPDLQPAR